MLQWGACVIAVNPCLTLLRDPPLLQPAVHGEADEQRKRERFDPKAAAAAHEAPEVMDREEAMSIFFISFAREH